MYTHPGFFIEQWVMEQERKLAEAKAKREKRRQEREARKAAKAKAKQGKEDKVRTVRRKVYDKDTGELIEVREDTVSAAPTPAPRQDTTPRASEGLGPPP